MGHRDGLLMTLNLSEAKNHGCRPHPRGSVRRASGFVLTSNPEVTKTKALDECNWWAGRESNPDLQLRTLPCCSVTLPTLWNSRRESNPDLFVRTEASSCLRLREPTKCGGDAEN